MSKLGVGVGEDFPVDENNTPEGTSDEEHAGGCCGAGARMHPWQRREAWRRFRDQMRSEFLARRQAMHEHMHSGENTAEAVWRKPYLPHLVIGALALIGLAALLGHHHQDR
jgi:hypothetical protein